MLIWNGTKIGDIPERASPMFVAESHRNRGKQLSYSGIGKLIDKNRADFKI